MKGRGRIRILACGKIPSVEYNGNPYDTTVSEWFDCIVFTPSNPQDRKNGVISLNRDSAYALYARSKNSSVDLYSNHVDWNREYFSTNVCKSIERTGFRELKGLLDKKSLLSFRDCSTPQYVTVIFLMTRII